MIHYVNASFIHDKHASSISLVRFFTRQTQKTAKQLGIFTSIENYVIFTRDVKVSRPAWSRDHFFGLGLGLGLTVIGLGLGIGLMR